MKKQRILALVLALLLLLTTFSLFSCDEAKDDGNETTTTKKTEETTTEAKQVYGNVPDSVSFGGQEEVRFLTADTSRGNGSQFSVRSIGFDDYTLGNNTVDDEVFKRNKKAEERLGVIISNTATTSSYIMQDAVYADLQSGASDYDVLVAYQAMDIMMAKNGIVMNMNSLDDYDADYLDFKADYWGTTYTNAITYNNLLFWATGDLSLMYIGGTYCTYVNTELYANAIEGQSDGNGGTYGSIYSVVEDHQWTLETLTAMAKMVYKDDGSTVGKVDKEDTLGFIIEQIDPLDGLAVGAGVDFSSLDPGGNIYIVLGSEDDNNKAADFIDAVYNLLYKSGAAMDVGSNHSANNMGYFANGNVLFVHDKIYQAENYLTNMEIYGIIPSPMLNTEQSAYRSAIHDECGLFGIYTGCANIPAAAATLEVLACLSLETVTPAYYDTALKYRYTRDENSAEMIELIRNSVYIDFAFAWGNAISSIHNFFRGKVNKPATSSLFRSYTSVWEGGLEELLEDLDEVAEQLDK